MRFGERSHAKCFGVRWEAKRHTALETIFEGSAKVSDRTPLFDCFGSSLFSEQPMDWRYRRAIRPEGTVEISQTRSVWSASSPHSVLKGRRNRPWLSAVPSGQISNGRGYQPQRGWLISTVASRQTPAPRLHRKQRRARNLNPTAFAATFPTPASSSPA